MSPSSPPGDARTPGGVDRARLTAALAAETEAFRDAHPLAAQQDAAQSGGLLGGVPMPWMRRWAGGFPMIATHAKGARVWDIDGHEYVDFCLGDTGAMTGHAPDAVVAAAAARLAAGTTLMLPTEDAMVVGDDLRRRFGLPAWQITLSATDANRNGIRMARHLTGREKVLCFSYSYHGGVDETFAVAGPGGTTVAREGNVGPPVDVARTTRAIEFNDVPALEAALAHGDVACVIAEPAMTNMGIVLPDPGYHDALRRLTREAGTLLIIDETHTFSTGPTGATGAWSLEPDMFTIGKAIAGGVPAGALGLTAELAGRLLGDADADLEDTGGIGGTLAGNALTMAAMRAALESVLTVDNFAHATAIAGRLLAGIEATIAEFALPWNAVQLGTRVEYHFTPAPARNGTEAHDAIDATLERYLHLYALNRGVMITPFHNMLLAAPSTTEADADRHTEVFRGAVAALGA